MAQRHIYVDSSVRGSGTGTPNDPYRTLTLAAAGALSSSGDINHLHLKSRSLFTEFVPTALSNASGLGLYIDTYGGSDPAVIDITTAHPLSGWTYDASFDWYSKLIGTNTFGDVADRFTMGCLLEDGVPMKFQTYQSSQIATRNLLRGGGYSYDWLTGICYMVPTSPGHSNYRAATHHFILTMAAPGFFTADTLRWNKSISGVRFVGSKVHASALNTDRVLFEDCEFFGHGGRQTAAGTSSFLGNGVECGQNTSNVVIRRCKFEQIFDSGVTAQTFGTPNVTNDILFEDCEFIGCGLSAIEISVQAGSDASTSVINVMARRNLVRDSATSWAPAIYAGRYRGITVVNNAAAATLNRIAVISNTIRNLPDTGITTTESGTTLKVKGNDIQYCSVGIDHVTNGAPTTALEAFENEIFACGSGIRTRFVTDQGTTTYHDNIINRCNIGFEETGAVNAPCVLNDNVLNATEAVVSYRTTGLTGSGNSSTGHIDPTYDYLFT